MKKSKSQRQNLLQRKRDERTKRRQLHRQRKAHEFGLCDDNAKFTEQMNKLGLKIRQINGDGNCLFRALADQLNGDDSMHMDYRRQVVTYMIKHRQDFEPFVENDVPFDKHIELLSREGTYAGNDALVAFARIQQVRIVIHQLDKPCWQIQEVEYSNEDYSQRELHISYHDFEHYSSVRKINDDNPSGAAGILSNRLNASDNICQNRTKDSDKDDNKQCDKKKKWQKNKMLNANELNHVEHADDFTAVNKSTDHAGICKDITTNSNETKCQGDVDDSDDDRVSFLLRNTNDGDTIATVADKWTTSSYKDNISQPNEIELHVMQLSGCQDMDLIRHALVEYNYDIDPAIAYILQVITLVSSDQQAKSDAVDLIDNMVSDDNNDYAKRKVSSSKSKDQSVSNNSKNDAAMKGRSGGNRQQTKKHLSNRKRKELAKKERKARKDQKHGHLDQLATEDNPDSVVTNIKLLHI